VHLQLQLTEKSPSVDATVVCGGIACCYTHAMLSLPAVVLNTPASATTLASVSMSILMTAGKKAAQAKAAEKESKKKKKVAAAGKSAAANRFDVIIFSFCRTSL